MVSKAPCRGSLPCGKMMMKATTTDLQEDGMRKITKLALNALMNGDYFKLDNTEVYCEAGGTMTMLLHGSPIVRRVGSSLWVTTGGWDTTTTKERINAVLQAHGKRAHHVKGQLMLYSKTDASSQPWDGSWIQLA